MLSPQDVQQMIEGVLNCEHVFVQGDGHHFFAKIISSEFEGKSLIQRHRLVKKALENRFASDELHALSISLSQTPEEWKNANPNCRFPGETD